MIDLRCGDCLEVMKDLSSDSVDLTVTSPPYDNLRTYNGYNFNFEGIAQQLFRVTKPGGVVVWVVGDATIKGSETGTSFKQALYFKEIGFNLHDTMIYAKKNPIPLTHNRYEQAFEYMFVLSRGKPTTTMLQKEQKLHKSAIPGNFYKKASDDKTTKHSNKQDTHNKLRTNIWTYVVGHNYLQHPAVFPEQLAKDHILSWSNEGDTILDPMMGSGTTGKMAKLLKRNFIGIEISPEYFELAGTRINTTQEKPL